MTATSRGEIEPYILSAEVMVTLPADCGVTAERQSKSKHKSRKGAYSILEDRTFHYVKALCLATPNRL